MSNPSSHKFHAGQLLCGGFQGTNVTAQAYHLIVEHHVSAMILSKKNAVSVKQMTKLIRDLQYIAYQQANYKYPLLFAIDEEGGMMNSLFDPEFISQFPGAMAMAATGDSELVYQILKAIAIELKHIGFLIILGPVLDVVTKLSHQLVGVRSFGTTVEEVTKYGKACARGLKDGGLLTVGKHFPGIGNAGVDSLLELPMMADSLDQIKQCNSVPFAELIKEGLLDGMSAAGCGVPTISPDETHACLSPVVINQLLRQELKFDGMVISECLEMDALFHSIGLGQGVILALYAGCDLVMVCHDKALQDEAVESIEKALANGNLDEEIISTCIRRIERLQKTLPTWNELFPRGEDSAKEDQVKLFKDKFPAAWKKHESLSQLSYRKSITLVRDYASTLPITKFLDTTSVASEDNTNNLLLLTPLLNPIYPVNHDDKDEPRLYPGEEVFQMFGDYLSNHPKNLNSKNPYNVLHTTYTANGLTALHESLIENSKAVIVLTSEASRNMYQIGIVKYISILCGANPSSFGNTGAASYSQLAKPLIIVATLSPYDFFYNKSIGSAYLCCYDYTNNVLKELASVLMGDIKAEGCIPGEKKFVGKLRKRKSIESPNSIEKTNLLKIRKNSPPKRRWLVDEFDLNRDWAGLVNIWKGNTDDLTDIDDSNSINITNNPNGQISYQDEFFYRKLYLLLSSTSTTQKHFVIRNSSLNILYGFILTWVDESQDVPLDGDLTRADNDGKGDKIGSILYLLVDKSKRLQSIGKNLHARAIRYLIKEQKCARLTLGSSFPLFVFPTNSNLSTNNYNNKVVAFMNSVGWDISTKVPKKKHIMVLNDLNNWLVPKKIFRELTIVGVRFDICTNPEKLMKLIDSNSMHNEKVAEKGDTESSDVLIKNERNSVKELYMEAIKYVTNTSSYGVKIIIALEPTNQNVIGSIILFTSKSQMSKFYPFLEECVKENARSSMNQNQQESLVGAIIGPVIDPSYSNLTEIINFGLICSAITFAKTSDNEQHHIHKCFMVGIDDDKSGNINGIKEIGFQEWKYYHDYFDSKNDVAKAFLGEH